MNINNKINKINKLIINNKELLNIKYKERNDLLENISKNKNVKYDDLDKIDEYVESVEFENKKLEKDLEEIKKTYNLNINIKKDKTQLCMYYKSPKGCDRGDKCSFAHGKIELKQFMKPCFSGLKCYKKDCKYYHPKDWNYKNNIKTCEFFKNGYCKNEDNCTFEHKKNHENKEYQDDYIKEIVNNHLHEDNKKNNSNANIDNDNLSLNFKIFVDGKEYKNLETIFNNNNENNNVEFSNINSGVQKVEKENIDIGNISDDTIELISNFQDIFYKYIEDIKRNIDETFINDKEKDGIYLKFELNKIMSELLLFKINFEDITNIINNKGLI